MSGSTSGTDRCGLGEFDALGGGRNNGTMIAPWVIADESLEVGEATLPDRGSVNITGQYQVSGVCQVGCSAGSTASPGRAVVTYAQTASQPSVEDFGEAKLVGGQAYVRIGSDFANVIDQSASYLVVITPEGPSRGLYVTQKTPAGFTVMENPGGHSTLAFSYRIVARPFGAREPRLPMIPLPRIARHRPSGSSLHIPR